ncbi:PPE family protein [Mycobacterium sp.]|uniref:PPE family protein n=1 Tax=Mycobacterium sp. TaxID=1785 RepID=UPI0031D1667D
MLDFAALPPEVNSGRMYAGPGPGPMLAAAAAWDVLATELESTAAGYAAVLSGLTGRAWSGPAAAAMTGGVTPYVAWLQNTASVAEQTAAQAMEAAAAYEAAFAATVPPPVVAANRATLMALIATNFFGQNTPAIAATEAHYAEMWAQDAAAMYGYAGASSSASVLTPFGEPPATTDPAGLGTQAATVARAAGTAVSGEVTTLARLIAALPTALQQLTSTGAASSAAGVPLFGTTTLFSSEAIFGVQGLLGPTLFGQNSFFLANSAFRANSQVNLGTRIVGIKDKLEREAAQAAKYAQKYATSGLGAGLGSAPRVSAGMGQSGLVGSLSVPPGWAADPVAIRPAALALPDPGPAGVTAAAGAVAPPEPMPGSVFSQGLMSALSKDAGQPVHPKSKPVLVRNAASERGGRVSTRS